MEASNGKKAADDCDVEVTLELRQDTVAVLSVKSVGGGEVDGMAESTTKLGKVFEKKPSMVRNASLKIKKVSKDLKRLATLRRRRPLLDPTKSAAANALKGLRFISMTDDGAATWEDVERRFDKLTGGKTGATLHRSRFGECIYEKRDSSKEMDEWSKEFAGILFEAVARRRGFTGDTISKVELKGFWEHIVDQKIDSRLQTFFDMVDRDADGRITEEEIKQIISLSASANKLSDIQKQADGFARLMMEELDPDQLGYITIDNLDMLLLQAPRQPMENERDSRRLSKMLSSLKPTNDYLINRCCADFHYFLVDNWQRVWVVALWVAVMFGLYAYRYVEYKNKKSVFGVMGHCVCFAKGAAETLKLNMALILLPVCRNTITFLRNKTSLGIALPFDDNLNFHQVIAVAIAIGVAIHGISHMACDFPRILHARPEEYRPLSPYFGDEQPSNYWHFVKGWEGMTGIVMVILMAIAFTLANPWLRRNKVKLPKALKKLIGFNAFWYSHHLFIIVYCLLIIHGIKLYLVHHWYKKTTWMYLAIPIGLYAGERLIRTCRSTIEAVNMDKADLHPGNVLTLKMSKPPGFNYQSGQYIFIKCSAVSSFEWHPFSLTSSPRDDYISVHIRLCGDWTKQLGLVVSEAKQHPPIHNGPEYPKVSIDGPYGAPTQDYKKYEVVLLVALGIGATPMISVVKDILNYMKEEEDVLLEEGEYKRGSGSGGHDFRTRRAYFYWVTREFDCFKAVMNEVAEMDHKGIIEMHNYCSSVYEEGDARSALIAMVQSFYLAKSGVDIVSGTKVKSYFAKPDWGKVYRRIASNHPNEKIGVFYCGPPPPAKKLKQLACDFNHSTKTNTRFEFHKENF